MKKYLHGMMIITVFALDNIGCCSGAFTAGLSLLLVLAGRAQGHGADGTSGDLFTSNFHVYC